MSVLRFDMKHQALSSMLIAGFYYGFVQSGSSASFGDPLPGLTAEQLYDFVEGMGSFQTVVNPAPVFNHVSCVACHSSPAVGGGSDILVTRFGRMVNGLFDPMAEQGGSLLQRFSVSPSCAETVPTNATIVVQRQTTPTFGFGLIEAISDATIQANVRVADLDGIRGRVAMLPDVVSGQMRVGRFGWKNQQATLRAFAGDAYVNEMGITSRFFPNDPVPSGNTNLLVMCDTGPDPENLPGEDGKDSSDKFANFMRFLGPPPPVPLTPRAVLGKSIFQQIGCAKCHVPVTLTGFNDVEALSLKPVALYSDLLLHDMGSLGDGIAQSAAGTREMRTMPLWGARTSAPYLHDGRAATLEEAIREHDGEAANVRTRFNKLRPEDRSRLLEFLNSL